MISCLNSSLATVLFLLLTIRSFAQSPVGDQAIYFNRLLMEKNDDRNYKLIGAYKVVGTPFLFGEKNKGNLFSKEGSAYNIFLSYNTYNQEVEFYSTSNPDKSLMKEPGEIDSFSFASLPNVEFLIANPLKFIYGSHIYSTEKSYYLEVYAGKKFSIYKRYKSELGYVEGNLIKSELRQFDLECEYFYTDSEKKSIKKIKAIAGNVIKEFKSVKDLSSLVTDDSLAINTDEVFRKVFELLNN